MSDTPAVKPPRKKRTTSATPPNLLAEFVGKLNSNQAEYVRHFIKKHFGGDYSGTSDFEKELHEGIKGHL